MSQFLPLTEDLALQSIAAAVAAGVEAHPDVAAAKVVDRLQTALGPVVAQIVALIQSGLNSLPEVLAALTAAGVTLPSWASIVVTVLLALVKPAA
jgi:hypothetical protein